MSRTRCGASSRPRRRACATSSAAAPVTKGAAYDVPLPSREPARCPQLTMCSPGAAERDVVAVARERRPPAVAVDRADRYHLRERGRVVALGAVRCCRSPRRGRSRCAPRTRRRPPAASGACGSRSCSEVPKLRFSTVAPRSTATLKPAVDVRLGADRRRDGRCSSRARRRARARGRMSERPATPGGSSQPVAPMIPPTWLPWPTASRRREVVAARVADQPQPGRLVDAEVDRVVAGEQLALELGMAERDARVDEADRDALVARLDAMRLRRVDALVRRRCGIR